MSLFFGRQSREANLSALIDAAGHGRSRKVGTVNVTHDTALRHSAVWAALRLRANLISVLPCDVYRRAVGVQVEVAKPPLLVQPSPGWSFRSWMWATQYDLDRCGNAIGVIVERDALGFPKRVDLLPALAVSIKGRGPDILKYRHGSDEYDPQEIWHERQYRIAGSPVGLDPIAHAAWTIGGYLSAQEFALDYFRDGGHPKGQLRNTERAIVKDVADKMKEVFKASTEGGDLFVTGKDWEWKPSEAPAAAGVFLESQSASVVDVARYLDVPADLIDGAVSGQNVTYANLSQRALQLLVFSLSAPIARREDALTAAVPAPRFVKLNGDALLRMDPETRKKVVLSEVREQTLTPNEARAIDDRPPFTDADLAELAFFAQLGKPQTPTTQQALGADRAAIAPQEV